MNKRYRTFASYLSKDLVWACAVLYFLMLAGVAVAALRIVSKEAVKNAENTLDSAIADVELELTEVKTPVDNLAWVVQEHLSDPDYMYEITRRLVSENKYIIGSAVAFEPGYYPEKGKYYAPYSYSEEGSEEIHSFQMGNDDYDYFSKEWYMLASLAGTGYWCEPYFDDGGGDQMMSTYSLPITDADGNLVAILTADISLNELTDDIEAVRPYANAYTVLLGHSGAFISHPEKERILVQSIFSVARDIGSRMIESIGESMVVGESGAQKFTDVNGKRCFGVYGPLLNGWSAGLVCPYADVFSSGNKIILIVFLVMTMGLILLYVFVRRIIRRATQPITEYAYTALNIAKGNFSAHIPEVDGTDELQHLRQSFTYMEKSINRYITELRTTTVENERYEGELGVAKDIQMSMVPKVFPSVEGLDMCALMQPAKEVGGDLYDYVVKDRKLYFVVGDVSGKGVPAALFMSTAKYTFHLLAGYVTAASQVMTLMNNAISDGNDTTMFVTMFVGVIDLDTLEMDYCNGGHNPIVVISPEGKAEFLSAKRNLALGVFQGFDYSSDSVRLSKGSRLVIYTDGVTEGENRAKDQYGEERLLEFCSSAAASTASSDFVRSLEESVHSFAAGNPQNDDITIMSILLK